MRWVGMKSVMFLFVAFVLVSCGGGGGGGGGGTGSDGRSASQETGKAYYLYALMSPVEDGGRSQGSRHALGSISNFVKKVVRHPEDFQVARGGWEYDPDFDLYFRVTIDTPTRVRIEFRENPDGTGGSGFLDIRLVDGEPYPVAVTVDFGFAAGVYRISGNLRLDVVDANWNDVRLRANFSSSRPSTSVSFDLRELSGVVRGWFEARDSQDRLRLNNIVDNGSTFTADIVAGSLTGFLSINADGSGYCTVLAVDGTWRLGWDANYYATLTPPGGVSTGVGYLWELL